jgi:hypothetical protein
MNASFASRHDDTLGPSQLHLEAIEALGRAGILLVVAAGNCKRGIRAGGEKG